MPLPTDATHVTKYCANKSFGTARIFPESNLWRRVGSILVPFFGKLQFILDKLGVSLKQMLSPRHANYQLGASGVD